MCPASRRGRAAKCTAPSGREFSVRPTALPPLPTPTGGEPMMNDDLHVVHPRAAGLDVHKMEITATVRLCAEPGREPTCETRTFRALASGLDALVHLADRPPRRGGGPGGHRRLLAGAVACTHLRRHRGAITAGAARAATARPQDRYRRQPLVGPGVPVRARPAQFRTRRGVLRSAESGAPSAHAGRATQPGP